MNRRRPQPRTPLTHIRPVRKKRQFGAAMAEFLVATPALLLLGLGGFQGVMAYNAKTVLDYATFEAARTGAVTHAQTGPMRETLGLRLAPVFGGDGSAKGRSPGRVWIRRIRVIQRSRSSTPPNRRLMTLAAPVRSPGSKRSRTAI